MKIYYIGQSDTLSNCFQFRMKYWSSCDTMIFKFTVITNLQNYKFTLITARNHIWSHEFCSKIYGLFGIFVHFYMVVLCGLIMDNLKGSVFCTSYIICHEF